MIIEILAIILVCYLLLGFGFWIIPINSSGGYMICGFENYNVLFIVFWLPSLFNDSIERLIEK